MEWRDDGIILGVKRHGETGAIVELMTRAHGRALGLVRGGRSRRQQTALQPGNSVDASWRARLEEHLGVFVIEPTCARAGALMESAAALNGLQHVSALLRLLPERDPHAALFETLELIADHLHEPRIAPALVARFELAMLAELGFGLDLSDCVATGARDDLIYVSPRSGRAVSRAAGAPYAERLLPLPHFLSEADKIGTPSRQDVLNGFRLTGFFLERDVFLPRGLAAPDARAAFLASV